MNVTTAHIGNVVVLRVQDTRLTYPILADFATAAGDLIAAGEYKFFSPVFTFDRARSRFFSMSAQTSFTCSTRPCFEITSSIVLTSEVRSMKVGPPFCVVSRRAGITSGSLRE